MNVLKRLLLLLLKATAFVCVWFAAIILLAIIAPSSEDDPMPTPWAFAILVLPIVSAGLFMHPKLWIKTRSKIDSIKINIPTVKLPFLELPEPHISESKPAAKSDVEALPKPKLPISKKKRIDNVQALVREANYEYDCALAADSPIPFVIHWEVTTSILDELVKYRESVPSFYFANIPLKSRVVKDFQWKLRDSMERSIKIVIADLKGPHHNNKNGRFADYKSAFEQYSDRYDEETMDFACAAMKTVAKAAGIREFDFCGKHLVIIQEEVTRNTYNLDKIDFMDGHEFEYWCANLLSGIGFSDVHVTQGSGDQGVDILAQKDGIKYAVQCKCYSKDLGNTPIQEVVSGKTLYHCQIGAVMTNRYFTKGAKDAAEANGILLWDRTWIKNALDKRDNGDVIQEPSSQYVCTNYMYHHSEVEGDQMLPAAVDVMLETGQASVSMIQRHLNLGYARAARIMDEMEEKGFVGPFQGSKPRVILITKEQWYRIVHNKNRPGAPTPKR